MAGLATVALLALLAGAVLIAEGMNASLMEQPRLAFAVFCLPLMATAATIFGAIRERSSFAQASVSYLIAVVMLPVWLLLTR